MSTVGQIERATQNRVVKLLREQLGYTYLGNWEVRQDNSNIEERYLRPFLKRAESGGRDSIGGPQDLGLAGPIAARRRKSDRFLERVERLSARAQRLFQDRAPLPGLGAAGRRAQGLLAFGQGLAQVSAILLDPGRRQTALRRGKRRFQRGEFIKFLAGQGGVAQHELPVVIYNVLERNAPDAAQRRFLRCGLEMYSHSQL